MLKRLRGLWGGARPPAPPAPPSAQPAQSPELHRQEFHALVDLLRRIPAVALDEAPSYGMHSNLGTDGLWSLVFFLDTQHPLAEAVEGKISHVTSWLELTERFPPLVLVPLNPPDHVMLEDGAAVQFFDVSDDGTPKDNGERYRRLSLYTRAGSFSPDDACRWLLQKLPQPLDDRAQWLAEDGEAASI